MLVKECKKIDSKGRLQIPKKILIATGLENAEVYFDITRNGNLLLKKVDKAEKVSD